MQTTKDAIRFYHGKVDDLGKNLVELEKVIGSKSDNVRVVEDGKCLRSHSHIQMGDVSMKRVLADSMA